MATSSVDTGFVPGEGLVPNDTPVEPGNENMGSMEVDGQTYHYIKVGTRYYMFDSEASRQQFLEWASAVSGVEIDDLNSTNLFDIVKRYDFSGDWENASVQVMENGKPQQVWMVFVKAPLHEKIDTQASKDFFGGDIPYFPDGSLPYLNHRTFTFTGDPVVDGGQLAGLAGSARFLFEKNYGNKETTPVNLAALPDPIEELCKAIFGSNVTITQEHLNILKLMGLVTGDATQGVGTWALSSEGSECLSRFQDPAMKDFLPSMAMINMTQEDLLQASGASVYFSGEGYAAVPDANPPRNYNAADVEKLAGTVYGKMKDVEEPLPEGLGAKDGQQDMILKLIVSLLGLPANTTWDQLTPAQINTAVAMGLIGYDQATNTLFMTSNGATYLSSKATAPGTAPPEGTPAATQDSRLKTFWDALYIFYTMGGPQAADSAEVNNGYGIDNDRFGTMGIGIIANSDPNDQGFWDSIGLGHLSVEQRTQLKNACITMLAPENNGYLLEISRSKGLGDAEDGVFRTHQMHTWLMENHGDWQGDGGQGSDVRARDNFNNPSFTVPAEFVFDPNQLSMSAETQANLDSVCQQLFGKSFSSMTPDEKRKAIYILTTSFNLFAYTPPQYADVTGADGQTDRRVVTPGMLYTRPDFTVPGNVTADEHVPPEREEEEEEEEDTDYWYGNS